MSVERDSIESLFCVRVDPKPRIKTLKKSATQNRRKQNKAAQEKR